MIFNYLVVIGVLNIELTYIFTKIIKKKKIIISQTNINGKYTFNFYDTKIYKSAFITLYYVHRFLF